MASTLIDTLLRVLGARGARGEAAAGHEAILELLSRQDCLIRERVTTTAEAQAVHVLGVRGQGERPLWLVSSLLVGHGASEVPPRVDRATGRVFGAGALSGVADLVVKILAAARVPEAELKRPLCIAALEGLESQRDAALDLVGAPSESSGVALVGAPTDLTPWVKHPGSLTLKLALEREARHRRMPPMLEYHSVLIRGRGAHHRQPGSSVDALHGVDALLSELREVGTARLLSLDGGDGAEAIAARAHVTLATSAPLGALPEEVEVTPVPDGSSVSFPIDDLYGAWRRSLEIGSSFLEENRHLLGHGPPSGARLHVGRLRSRLNRLEGLVCVPTGHGYDAEGLVMGWTEAARAAIGERASVSVSAALLDDRPPLSGEGLSSDWSQVVGQALRELDLPSQMTGGDLTTDAGHLEMCGIPTVVWGAGRPDDLFTPNESVSIPELERALEFYESMIRRWCT